MKYLKMLGLAAIAAMGLMAFLGASSASATTLCTETATPCPAGKGINATEDSHVQAHVINTAVLETTSGTHLVECTAGLVTGTITNGGSSTETVSGSIEALSWSGCNQTVDTLAKGGLEIHHIAGTDNGTVTATAGTEVTVEIFGVSCTYGSGTGIHLGTLTGGTDPILDINTVVPKEAGGFLCPSTARWTAEYTVTTPAPMYVEP